MPAIQVPSFWDYLGSGLNQFVESFRVARERKEALREREKEREAEERYREAVMNLQRLNLLLERGADPQQAAALAARIPGMEGVQFLPSRWQMAADLIARTRRGEPVSPLEFSAAGLPQPEILEADLSQARLLRRTAESGLQTFDRDQQLERFQKLSPVLTEFANNYVAGEINRLGGRLRVNDLKVIGAQAYQRFLESDAGKAFGSLSPAEADQARQYFEAAAFGLWNQQLENDIRQLRLDIASGRADNTAQMLTALDRLAQREQQRINNIQREIGNLTEQLKNVLPETIGLFPGHALAAEQLKQLNQELAVRQGRLEKLENASALFAAGRLHPSAVSEMLQQYVEEPSVMPRSETPNILQRFDIGFIDEETRRAQNALRSAQTEEQRRRIRELYKQRTGRDLPK